MCDAGGHPEYIIRSNKPQMAQNIWVKKQKHMNNSDPTSKTQRKLNKMLLDLKKAGKISESTYKMLYSSDGLCPRFYGLPKIHKTGFETHSLLLILRLMRFRVISQKSCHLLLGILITLSKIPMTLRIL